MHTTAAGVPFSDEISIPVPAAKIIAACLD
jgi:hypothetical protein